MLKVTQQASGRCWHRTQDQALPSDICVTVCHQGDCKAKVHISLPCIPGCGSHECLVWGGLAPWNSPPQSSRKVQVFSTPAGCSGPCGLTSLPLTAGGRRNSLALRKAAVPVHPSFLGPEAPGWPWIHLPRRGSSLSLRASSKAPLHKWKGSHWLPWHLAWPQIPG